MDDAFDIASPHTNVSGLEPNMTMFFGHTVQACFPANRSRAAPRRLHPSEQLLVRKVQLGAIGKSSKSRDRLTDWLS
jgi:hypothetical protein